MTGVPLKLALCVSAALAAGAGCGSATAARHTAATPTLSAEDAVMTAHRCPAHPPPRVSNQGSGLDRELVPATGAATLVLCGYRSPGAAPSTPLVVTGPAVETWRGAFNALPPMPTGTYHCPMATGATVLADFVGARRHVLLRIEPTGCANASNGRLDRWMASVPPELRRLAA